jgi:hypothetical protein
MWTSTTLRRQGRRRARATSDAFHCCMAQLLQQCSVMAGQWPLQEAATASTAVTPSTSGSMPAEVRLRRQGRRRARATSDAAHYCMAQLWQQGRLHVMSHHWMRPHTWQQWSSCGSSVSCCSSDAAGGAAVAAWRHRAQLGQLAPLLRPGSVRVKTASSAVTASCPGSSAAAGSSAACCVVAAVWLQMRGVPR